MAEVFAWCFGCGRLHIFRGDDAWCAGTWTLLAGDTRNAALADKRTRFGTARFFTDLPVEARIVVAREHRQRNEWGVSRAR